MSIVGKQTTDCTATCALMCRNTTTSFQLELKISSAMIIHIIYSLLKVPFPCGLNSSMIIPGRMSVSMSMGRVSSLVM